MEEVINVIANFGFPAVACIYMAYLCRDMNEKHHQEVEDLKDALTENTRAIDNLQNIITIMYKQGDDIEYGDDEISDD